VRSQNQTENRIYRQRFDSRKKKMKLKCMKQFLMVMGAAVVLAGCASSDRGGMGNNSELEGSASGTSYGVGSASGTGYLEGPGPGNALDFSPGVGMSRNWGGPTFH
jgi:hypothetical protein